MPIFSETSGYDPNGSFIENEWGKPIFYCHAPPKGGTKNSSISNFIKESPLTAALCYNKPIDYDYGVAARKGLLNHLACLVHGTINPSIMITASTA